MTQVNEIFPKACNLLAVIHCQDLGQVIANIEVAKGNGADGVFLIDHRVGTNELLDFFYQSRKKYPDFFMGLNFLHLPEPSAERAIELVRMLELKGTKVDGLWLDDCGYDENLRPSTQEVEKINEWKIQYEVDEVLIFGGVAFKYKEQPTYISLAASQCARYVDVVTTSGDKTGSLPPLQKITSMKTAMANRPLANASGLTSENVGPYSRYLKFCIVGTALNYPGTKDFDPKRVQAMANAVAGVQVT